MRANRSNETGRFASKFDPVALYRLVEAVARFVDPVEPETVSQPKWDAARAAAGYPDAPSARAIYARLGRPWRTILEIACSESRELERTLAAQRSVPDRELTDAEIRFALNRVAIARGARSFTPNQYEQTIEELIRQDVRRLGEQSILADLLPTANQIITARGWVSAMQIAGLEVSSVGAGNPSTALSVDDAYDLVITLANGEAAPGSSAPDALRSVHGISVARPKEPWSEVDARCRAARASRGLTTPIRTLTKKECEALHIPSDLLESLPRKQVRGKWTYEKCVLAVVEYVKQLGAGEAPSRNGYRKRYTANGWPALTRVESHAHWSTMLDAAREALRTGELVSLEEAKKRWPSKIAQVNAARPAAA